MDPSSSSVRFPLSGNTQSPQNSTPLPSSFGFPPSGNTQSFGITPPLPSSSVAIPSSEYHQSTQNPSSLHPPSFPVRIPCSVNPQSNPEQQPPTLIVSDADWNRELARLFPNLNFCSFMRRGPCGEHFGEWYMCMFRAVYVGGDRANCSGWAGFLRDCIFRNQNYYHPRFVHFSDIISRR